MILNNQNLPDDYSTEGSPRNSFWSENFPHTNTHVNFFTLSQTSTRAHTSLTSKFLTRSLTLAAVCDDCFALVASLISVDKKFLHFFTFSIVSCVHRAKQSQAGHKIHYDTHQEEVTLWSKPFITIRIPLLRDFKVLAGRGYYSNMENTLGSPAVLVTCALRQNTSCTEGK